MLKYLEYKYNQGETELVDLTNVNIFYSNNGIIIRLLFVSQTINLNVITIKQVDLVLLT